MRTNRLLFITCSFLFFSHIAYSQENKSINEKGISGPAKPVKNKLSVFVSGGTSLASGSIKDSLFIGNGWNVEGGMYVPLFFNRIKARNNFSAGVETGIAYARQKTDGGQSLYARSFRLSDGNVGVKPSFENAGELSANSFQFFTGPTAAWTLGKLSVSPAVLFGYFSLNRKGYTLSETIVNPKQPAESKYIPFITATDYSASGFIIKPKIELGYHFTPQLSVFATGAVAFGPSIQNSFTFWKPQGGGSADNVYSYDQFASGAATTATLSSRWQTASINLGLRYTLIKSTFDNGHGGRKQRASMKGQPGKQNKVVVRGWDPEKKKSIVGRADSTTNVSSRLSMTPTTTKQTENRDFGEKVSAGLQSAGNLQSVVRADSTPKPGGAASSSYAAPGRVVQTGDTKDTTGMPSRLSMTPTTTRQTQGASSQNSENPMHTPSVLARPGQPIKDVIVKGGKNPGGQLISAISGDNGEVLLNNLEAGTYLFQLGAPEQPAGKSISEKGLKRSDNAVVARPGQPIGGIVVKGGKNPGGNFTNLTVSNDGQIGFEVLEAGNYKLIITAPDANNPSTIKSKKKTENPSGLKNVMKTRHDTTKNSISNVR